VIQIRLIGKFAKQDKERLEDGGKVLIENILFFLFDHDFMLSL
jgi:hypothetical protein